jgi:hypothetical protein
MFFSDLPPYEAPETDREETPLDLDELGRNVPVQTIEDIISQGQNQPPTTENPSGR